MYRPAPMSHHHPPIKLDRLPIRTTPHHQRVQVSRIRITHSPDPPAPSGLALPRFDSNNRLYIMNEFQTSNDHTHTYFALNLKHLPTLS
jgi:hypothetical protein